MKVSNIELYHIHRKGHFSDQWAVGNTIIVDPEIKNPFSIGGDEYNCVTSLTNGHGEIELFTGISHFLEQPETYRQNNYEALLKESQNRLRQNAIYLRELLFEQVRSKEYQHLPSRESCIWLCEKHALKGWFDSWKTERTVFKVRATGNLHKGDNKHLNIGTHSLNQFRDNARQYWKGSDGLDPQSEEIIFSGKLEIVDKYTRTD